MTKILKYLKPYWFSILLAFGLLFGQATCELTMPDYMQNIVNTGIQNSGIESGVYQQISEKTLNSFLMFATDSEKDLITSSYKLVESASASKDLKSEIPALKKENVYLLKDISESKKESLQDCLTLLQMTVMEVSQAASKQNVQIPQLLMMNGVDTYRKDAKSEISKLGTSTVSSMSSQFLKKEYTDLGMDMEKIQQDYIISSGIKMLGYALASAVCAILVGFLASRIAAGFSKNLRQSVFEKVTHFSNENLNTFSTSSLITRTTNDIQQLQMTIVMFLRIVMYAPIIGVGAILHVIESGANMTWILALCVVVILSVVLLIFMIVMPKFKVMQKMIDKMNSVVRELLDGMLVIRAFNNEKIEEEKFDKANSDITSISLFTTRAMAIMMPIMMFLMNATTLMILWFGSKQVDAGIIQVGSIMAFMQYAMQVIMAFLMITMVTIMLPRANVSAQRIQEVLSSEITVTDKENTCDFSSSMRGVVTFDNVSFRYPGADEDVLSDISFSTKPGQTTAFIGSTGSGKSTLINLVPRFYDVTSGSICVDGVDIRDVKQVDLRSRIGYVPQKGMLLSGDIESNLLYSKKDANENDIQSALDISQSSEFVNKKPEGIHSEINQGGTNVSGGQRQRLSIARAIVRKPEIYIFDDSFSALDFKTDAKLREALAASCKETKSTVLLVAQRISSILHADQIIVLDEGKMVGKGTHEELMESCKVYQQIASSQLTKEELANV
ncbi:ABC transporter ATP-binding protein/permease [Holdemanella biformis]|uniref:ABC transporter ATP-binding protein n=1 Tax=Holdemanella biformis TaxID=1735 RepID=UPI001C27C7F7|nr:ABC transporter ATP-binding protein [Holdemanella biformis]MBU9896752.1 ABC transporter ATP-binding protein/permease [Holdemanella biformis]MBV3417837.1 ABC transporter ATP-binding protein/permease [Holdemanella biformis]